MSRDKAAVKKEARQAKEGDASATSMYHMGIALFVVCVAACIAQIFIGSRHFQRAEAEAAQLRAQIETLRAS